MRIHQAKWSLSIYTTLFFALLLASPTLQAMSKSAPDAKIKKKAHIKKSPSKTMGRGKSKGKGKIKVKTDDKIQNAKKKSRTFHFDKVASGQLPAGWKIEETNAGGSQASWQIINDKSAPSTPRVLSLVDSKKHTGETFNLCWTDKVRFGDGTLQVHFKANSGKEDQGGGLMWRVQDKNNYYIVRFNPLEDNFRLYVVKNAQRHQLLSTDVHLKAGQWHSMKVVQKGHQFSAYLDDKKLLEGSDDTFAKVGGVGLWTKADAATSFDNFTVSAL